MAIFVITVDCDNLIDDIDQQYTIIAVRVLIVPFPLYLWDLYLAILRCYENCVFICTVIVCLTRYRQIKYLYITMTSFCARGIVITV